MKVVRLKKRYAQSLDKVYDPTTHGSVRKMGEVSPTYNNRIRLPRDQKSNGLRERCANTKTAAT